MIVGFEIVELGELIAEIDADGIGRPMALLSDDDFGFDFSFHSPLAFPTSLAFLDLEGTDVCAYCIDAWLSTTTQLRQLRLNTCTTAEKLQSDQHSRWWLCKERLPQIARDVEVLERWRKDYPLLEVVWESKDTTWDSDMQEAYCSYGMDDCRTPY